MPTFNSPRFKSLRVADLGVRFTDGVLEVKEGPQAERLRGLSSFGVTESADREDIPRDLADEPADGESQKEVQSGAISGSEPEEKPSAAKRRSRTS